MRSLTLVSFITLMIIAGCSPGNEIKPGEIPPLPITPFTDLPPSSHIYDEWPRHTISDINLSFAYPPGWYVHEALKALQITPNSQPLWSSFANPSQPNDGPYFDLLYNLNRQMAETPLAEVENILRGYDQEIEAVEPAAPLVSRPDVVIGAYRYVAFDDGFVLLVGSAGNPLQNSPQPVIALVALVKQDELATMKPIFEGILLSISLAEQ